MRRYIGITLVALALLAPSVSEAAPTGNVRICRTPGLYYVGWDHKTLALPIGLQMRQTFGDKLEISSTNLPPRAEAKTLAPAVLPPGGPCATVKAVSITTVPIKKGIQFRREGMFPGYPGETVDLSIVAVTDFR